MIIKENEIPRQVDKALIWLTAPEEPLKIARSFNCGWKWQQNPSPAGQLKTPPSGGGYLFCGLQPAVEN